MANYAPLTGKAGQRVHITGFSKSSVFTIKSYQNDTALLATRTGKVFSVPIHRLYGLITPSERCTCVGNYCKC